MAESDLHRHYVQEINSWFQGSISNWQDYIVYCDNGNILGGCKAKIGKFVPDFYAITPSKDSIIIGEAKTAYDLETKHTQLQLEEYISYGSSFADAKLVVAVPWTSVCSAKSLIKLIKRKYNIVSVVEIYLQDLPEQLWA